MSNLANTYRPLILNDLIGQDVMVQTITNAIKLDRISNSFLLTGSHGIGKTSTARILAKSFNCHQNISVTPCMNCSSCNDINKSTHLDVLELDAASNTSVDDIRALLENAKYLPSQSRFKIYIIDEVHMLSKSAFNALLKTLEEPYQHVKFILATTELNKVPATIISRCQRFQLKRINNRELAQYICNVASKEKAKITSEASLLIAKSADGSVRDSLSILEQVISYTEGNINIQDVRKVIGISDSTNIIQLVQYIIERESEQLLKLFNEIYHAGSDSIVILNEVLELFHTLSKVKIFMENNHPLYDLAGKISIELLNRLWQALSNGIQTVISSPNTYLNSEMILLRLCYLSSLPAPSEIINNMKCAAQTIPIKHLTPQSILDLCRQNNEAVLLNYLTNHLQITNINANLIKLDMIASIGSLSEFKSKFIKCLTTWTNSDWRVEIVDKSKKYPIIDQVMNHFNTAKVISIKQHKE